MILLGWVGTHVPNPLQYLYPENETDRNQRLKDNRTRRCKDHIHNWKISIFVVKMKTGNRTAQRKQIKITIYHSRINDVREMGQEEIVLLER